ncbi:Uncharacterised protein [uncultured archaeon]|nr:Uncharacterised protein [uncultured archaeon]
MRCRAIVSRAGTPVCPRFCHDLSLGVIPHKNFVVMVPVIIQRPVYHIPVALGLAYVDFYCRNPVLAWRNVVPAVQVPWKPRKHRVVILYLVIQAQCVILVPVNRHVRSRAVSPEIVIIVQARKLYEFCCAVLPCPLDLPHLVMRIQRVIVKLLPVRVPVFIQVQVNMGSVKIPR